MSYSRVWGSVQLQPGAAGCPPEPFLAGRRAIRDHLADRDRRGLWAWRRRSWRSGSVSFLLDTRPAFTTSPRAHRETYHKFWAWSDAIVDRAMMGFPLWTVFGLRLSEFGSDPNPRSLRNVPCQANGAEMLRLAACFATKSRAAPKSAP